MPEFVEDVSRPDETEKVNDITKKITGSSEDNAYVDDYISKFVEISTNAQDNERQEKAMSLLEGIKTFPKAAFWSIVLSTAIVMEGYDTALLSSLYGLDVFARKYGQYYPDLDEYQIPAKWQTSLSMSTNVGEIIGLYAAGLCAEKWGYRKTLMSFMTATIGFIFIVFFSVNVGMLLAGEMLCGVIWGAFQTLTVSYASEVCPVVLRIYLTTYVNACWVIGQLIASGILKGTSTMTTQWAYRIPWAVQWVWPLPIIFGIYCAPESPWWLVKKGRTVAAKKSIMRLLSPTSKLPNTEPLAEAMLNKMQLTIKAENEVASNTSYLDCFSKANWRRTRVASIIWIFQNITGSGLMGFSTYFYEQAGMSTSMAFTFSIIQYALGLAGTLLSWVLSQRFGRFDIYFGGLLANFFILIIVGAMGFHQTTSTSWAIGTFLLIFTFIYDATIGPITYCVVAEIPSSAVRAKSVGVARNMYNVAGIPVAIITPYMLNPTAWNWKAKSGLFWAAFALIALVYCWFEFPETKGRTYAELDILFAQGVPARKFKYTEVEAFNAHEMLEKMEQDEIVELVDADKQAEVVGVKA